MMVLEFEATVDEHGMIRVPESVTAGTTVRVSITPVRDVSAMTPDEAWAATLAFIESRMAKGPLPGEYKWRREDAYEHLNRYGIKSSD